ncbi:MAG: carbohydrate binding domain-containing protein [Phycisphaerae bacterium]
MNAAKNSTNKDFNNVWLVPLVLFLATMFQSIASGQDKSSVVPADVKTPEAAARKPSAEFLRENLVMNPGMEKSGQEELEYWAFLPSKSELSAITVDDAESHSGKSSLRISQANADSFSVCKQNIPVEPGTDYTVTCWMKGENIVITEGSEGAHMLIGKTDGHGIKGAAIQQGSFPWKKTTMTFNSGSENTVVLHLYLHFSTGDVWYDDVEMVKGLE